jgi:hypothetical protein
MGGQILQAIYQQGGKNARCSSGMSCGLALKHNDAVGEIRGHNEIVLNNEGGLLCVEDESVMSRLHVRRAYLYQKMCGTARTV